MPPEAPEVGEEGSLVWRALADPTRRRILDLLRARPRITGEVASYFDVSRVAVMRHLEVLSSAGLVTSRKRGRERWHYLNAIPLQRIHERWVDAHTEVWASRLLRVGGGLIGRSTRMSVDRPALDISLDVSIGAAPHRVFAALTGDPGGWWGRPFLRSEAVALTLDRRLGGLLVEKWATGGAVLATVTGWADGRRLELTGAFHLGLALGIAAFELTAVENGTSVQFSFRAIGAIEAEFVEKFAEGWRDLVDRLKTLTETGARLGIAPDPLK